MASPVKPEHLTLRRVYRAIEVDQDSPATDQDLIRARNVLIAFKKAERERDLPLRFYKADHRFLVDSSLPHHAERALGRINAELAKRLNQKV